MLELDPYLRYRKIQGYRVSLKILAPFEGSISKLIFDKERDETSSIGLVVNITSFIFTDLQKKKKQFW